MHIVSDGGTLTPETPINPFGIIIEDEIDISDIRTLGILNVLSDPI